MKRRARLALQRALGGQRVVGVAVAGLVARGAGRAARARRRRRARHADRDVAQAGQHLDRDVRLLPAAQVHAPDAALADQLLECLRARGARLGLGGSAAVGARLAEGRSQLGHGPGYASKVRAAGCTCRDTGALLRRRASGANSSGEHAGGEGRGRPRPACRAARALSALGVLPGADWPGG